MLRQKLGSKGATFFILLFALAAVSLSAVIARVPFVPGGETQTLSKLGSSGKEVTAIQDALRDRGLFQGESTGYYGTKTQAAVKQFQRQKGLTVDGIAGPQTLSALGISVGTVPQATESNIYLLARKILCEV